MTEKIWTPSLRERPTRPAPFIEDPLWPGIPYAPVPDDDPRWAELQKEFPPSQIGHKPTVWCKPCREAGRKVCDQHQKTKCRTCGQNITTAHIDLDYVGHAAVTKRIISVDKHWDWRWITAPEREERGFPNPGNKGLWIWLRILGKTLPGLGETEGGVLEGANAIKACMSDAIKNASMRFGVAIELWSKEDLSDEAALAAEKADEQVQQQREQAQQPDVEEGLRRINACTTLEELQIIYDAARKNNAYRGQIKEALTAKRKEIQEKAKAEQQTPDENPGEAAAPEGTDPS